MAKIYFCGPAGRVEYFDTGTSTWHDMSFASVFGGSCIHGTGPNNIWVGTSGYYNESYMELWHWDGNSWTMHQIPTGYMWGAIMGVWSLGPNETYIVTDESNYSGIYKWDGVQIQTLWVNGNNSYNFTGIEALSSTEVYIWGGYMWGTGLFRWNGSSLDYETWTFPNEADIRCFTAVSSTEQYLVVIEYFGYENKGKRIYKGSFGGSWAVDYDWVSESGANGFVASGSGLHCDRDTGFVWGVTSEGASQPFRQRIKSGGSWSYVDVPEHDPTHMTDIHKAAIGPGGLVRAIPCIGYGAYDDTCTYDGSWSFHDRINGGLAASWILDIDIDVGATTVSTVTPIAKDVIKLIFASFVVVNEGLLNPDSYSIAAGIAVKTVLPPEDDITDSILLQLSPGAVAGTEYEITIPSAGIEDKISPDKISVDTTLYTPDGSPLKTMSATWTHHKTKVDAVLRTLPQMYKKSTDSVVRMLLQSIGMSDEAIGGDF